MGRVSRFRLRLWGLRSSGLGVARPSGLGVDSDLGVATLEFRCRFFF